mgnify:CR=1 FL=1
MEMLHLGYPFRIESCLESHFIQSQRALHKNIPLESQTWIFHMHLKSSQKIMLPVFSYYFTFIAWSKTGLQDIGKLICYKMY